MKHQSSNPLHPTNGLPLKLLVPISTAPLFPLVLLLSKLLAPTLPHEFSPNVSLSRLLGLLADLTEPTIELAPFDAVREGMGGSARTGGGASGGPLTTRWGILARFPMALDPRLRPRLPLSMTGLIDIGGELEGEVLFEEKSLERRS